jgi:hypothetical protein
LGWLFILFFLLPAANTQSHQAATNTTDTFQQGQTQQQQTHTQQPIHQAGNTPSSHKHPLYLICNGLSY